MLEPVDSTLWIAFYAQLGFLLREALGVALGAKLSPLKLQASTASHAPIGGCDARVTHV
jgi:hypothetical protein